MISTEFYGEIHDKDPLIAARNAICQAMFERAAIQANQDFLREIHDRHTSVSVKLPDVAVAASFLELLREVQILNKVTIEAETGEEYGSLRDLGYDVAINPDGSPIVETET